MIREAFEALRAGLTLLGICVALLAPLSAPLLWLPPRWAVAAALALLLVEAYAVGAYVRGGWLVAPLPRAEDDEVMGGGIDA